MLRTRALTHTLAFFFRDAVRHIESIMRMAEAHAKMHLREHVREDDMDAAIKIMLHGFVQAQKFSVRRSLQKGFRKYLNTNSDKTHLLLHTLQKFCKDNQTYLLTKKGCFRGASCKFKHEAPQGLAELVKKAVGN